MPQPKQQFKWYEYTITPPDGNTIGGQMKGPSQDAVRECLEAVYGVPGTTMTLKVWDNEPA